MLIWLILIGYCSCLRPVVCVSMINGSELVADPYNEGVLIQEKPATTICMGIISDERTVFTSALCEVGMKTVDNYHVVEAPHYKAPPPYLLHNIKTIQRGKGTPFDLKVITLEEPFEFCANCSASKVLWVETYDDYTERLNLKTPGVLLGFGPPFKAGIVTYKINADRDCQQDYMTVKEASWPARMPFGSFCIYEGSASINISIPNKRWPVTTKPGVPCDDSVGSLVKINDYGRTLGIVIKGFCGAKRVALGWGSYYLLSLPFEPDDWTPPPPSTTTCSTTPVSPTTTTNSTSSSTTITSQISTKTSTAQPRTKPATDPASPSKAINISICFCIQILVVCTYLMVYFTQIEC